MTLAQLTLDVLVLKLPSPSQYMVLLLTINFLTDAVTQGGGRVLPANAQGSEGQCQHCQQLQRRDDGPEPHHRGAFRVHS
jgi:hypothetical protein